MWNSYSGLQKCHAKVLRHDFWRSCFVFGSCLLRGKCSSPTFMRVKSLEGFKTEKDSPKKLLYAPLILHGEAPSVAQDYLLPLVFLLSPNICPKFCFWYQTLIHSSDLGPIFLWLTTWLMLFRLTWYDSDQWREERIVQFTFQINIFIWRLSNMLFSSYCEFVLLWTVSATVSALLRFPEHLLPDPSPVFSLPASNPYGPSTVAW